MAERILAEANDAILKKGFKDDQIIAVHRKKKIGIASDICNFAVNKKADSVLISAKGRSRLEAFFSGEVANKILEYCRVCPVWVVEGSIRSKKTLCTSRDNRSSARTGRAVEEQSGRADSTLHKTGQKNASQSRYS